MKSYRYQDVDFTNKMNTLVVDIKERQANNSINYMEIKEYSEKMEHARTQAQYEILRFKNQFMGEKKEPEKLRQAINEYKIMKATYFGLYHAYMEQCQNRTANDHHITRRRRKAA